MAPETERNKWISKHEDLIDWLRTAEDGMLYGDITINYREGDIYSIDVSDKRRVNKGSIFYEPVIPGDCQSG